MAKGITSKPPKKNKNKNQGGKYPGLNAQQKKPIDQRNKADAALGQQANAMLPQVNEAYAQPFNWDEINQMAPVQGDWKNYVDQGVNQYNQAFDARMNPVFNRQNEELAQWASTTGNAPGSPAYKARSDLLAQQQSDARSQAYTQGRSQAFNEAGQAFDIGTSAQQNKYNMGLAQRNMPLSEFNQLYAAQSGMPMQNLGFSQQNYLQQHAPRGGGGGGAAPPSWTQQGFSSYQDQQAFNDARQRSLLQYQSQLGQQGQPSYSSQLMGNFGGSLLAGLGQGIGKSFAG